MSTGVESDTEQNAAQLDDELHHLLWDEFYEGHLLGLDTDRQSLLERYSETYLRIENTLISLAKWRERWPDNPEFWFHTGWINLVYAGDFLQTGSEIEKARAAFHKTLQLDPDNVWAHFALAYLTYVYGPYSSVEKAGDRSAAWDEPCGKHLQAALASGGPVEAYADIGEHRVHIRPIIVWDGWVVFLSQLEALSQIVPEHLRADFCYAVAIGLEMCGITDQHIQEDDEGSDEDDPFTVTKWARLGKRWKDKASENAFHINLHRALGIANERLDQRPEYFSIFSFKEITEALLRAYNWLLEMPAAGTLYKYWLEAVKRLAQLQIHHTRYVGPEWVYPDCQKVYEIALRPGSWNTASLSLSSWSIPLAAGQIAHSQGNVSLAERYYLRAREAARDWHGQFLGSAEDFPISICRHLSDLYIEQRRWGEALAEQQSILDINPNDTDAQRWSLVLTIAKDTGLPENTLEKLLDCMAEIKAKQDRVLSEVVVQKELQQQIADVQRQIFQQVRQRQDSAGTEKYSELVNELHKIVQESARIRPSAIQEAHKQLVGCLGDGFYALLPDTQHFLATGKLFHHAGADLPKEVDVAAIVAVEYAKAAETELKGRLMLHLGRFLDQKNIQRILMRPPKSYQQQGESWEATLTSVSITLGSIARLLQTTHEHQQDNRAVLMYLKERLKLDDGAIFSLAEDILKAVKLRNGAAHTKRLNSDNLESFHALLFANTGLLQQLVRIAKAISSQETSG